MSDFYAKVNKCEDHIPFFVLDPSFRIDEKMTKSKVFQMCEDLSDLTLFMVFPQFNLDKNKSEEVRIICCSKFSDLKSSDYFLPAHEYQKILYYIKGWVARNKKDR